MLDVECLNAIDFFFSATGPTKIIVTYEGSNKLSTSAITPKSNQPGTPGKPNQSNKKLKVYSDEIETTVNSAVFFMKVKKGKKEGDDRYAIDPSKINDGTISFGIIRSPLESLEAVMRCVYKPMMQDMGTEVWGQASMEQKTEFMSSLELFTKGLQESIRNISGGLELTKPDNQIEMQITSSSPTDSNLVIKSLNLLQEWCNKIEKYLDDSDRGRWETPDSGPDTELDYWRSRMQRYLMWPLSE